ncbi:hypothetical protein HS041_03585 [Planomonospora sp. ID67723]|uniref:hypothetical protein n=1 Tax=Planomonospora sp. ID67723 TaxID=2738134 RepID=UPI0018C37567|nr:hypothetical protein [Planomonospora sp. ID67723]MBG0826855.1 hypothetical protein [Planomonospora sp. ID67723]
MNASTGTGNTVLGPGQWAAWVNEHGAHLLDYAGYHLGAEGATAAAAAAVASCGAAAGPEGVSVRARLLAALRRDCSRAPGHRPGYVPGTGPGMPGALLMERAWGLVDPLGAESLRLMFRHELTLEDLCHVLALPADEIGRLATRTQDIIETLVSALDGLAHGRAPCAALRPLVDSAFPGEPWRQAGGSGDARAELLSHMVRCPVCTRPISIRYTVPQMISHPPIPPLTAEAGRRFLDALPPAVPLSAPPSLPAAPVRPTGSPADPPGAAAPPTVPNLPVRRGTAPYAAGRGPAKPARPKPLPPPPATPGRREEETLPSLPAVPHRLPPGEETLPSLPAVPRSRPSPALPEPGRDTPLYDALLSQVWAREILARTGGAPLAGRARLDVSASIPAPALRSATRPSAGSRAAPAGRDRGPERRRLAEALLWAGARVRATTVKIVIIVVAGAAGTLTGMNLLGPALGDGTPARSLPSSLPQAATTAATAAPPTADRGELSARLRMPSEIALDEYGRGGATLTSLSEDVLQWRVSAPGLAVNPSSGTLKRGDTVVITLRALRVRYWCGAPAPVTAPLTLHGPDDSISATVRWRTC